MKYKQRLLIALVTLGVLVCVYTTYYRISRVKLTPKGISELDGFAVDALHPVIPGKCPNSRVTSDFMVDDFYENLSFRTNTGDGLYVLNDTKSVHKHSESGKSRPKPLTIIVVPHSHNDPGWLWTLNTYYEVRTKHILSNTVKFLTATPDFRMIWSETIFLKMWWEEATQEQKLQLKKLSENGQLEILSGGWVSVDEATTHYTAVLDQLIEGHLWVRDNLGVTVNTSWSIDPFGYSLTLPYLWKKSGMKNMAILRIHGAIKTYMSNRQLLTYKWRQPWDARGLHDITCHVEPYTLYNIEHSCGPNMQVCKKMDFAREPDFPPDQNQNPPAPDGIATWNFEHVAELIVEQYRLKAANYKHNVILMPHGDDFRYISDYEWDRQYVNMKRLIMYVNSRKEWNIKMKFGTVGEYFDILNDEIHRSELSGSKEPVLSGDFFTYTDRDNEYWSGYYTTRPFDKRMIRSLLELLKVTEIVTSYAIVHAQQRGRNFVDLTQTLAALQSARRTHGLVQHHDAITGTSAHPTVVDFEKRVFDAISKLQQVLGKSVQSLILNKTSHEYAVEPLFIQTSADGMMNQKVLQVTESGSTLIFINGHSQRRKEVLSVLVNTLEVTVLDENGKQLELQMSPYMNGNVILSNNFEVFFELSIPPLSYVTYTIKRSTSSFKHVSSISVYNGKLTQPGKPIFDIKKVSQNSLQFENNYLVADFSTKSGTLQRLCSKYDTAQCVAVKLDWVLYQTGNSNAYTFGTTIKGVDSLLNSPLNVISITGKLVSKVITVHQHFQHISVVYHTAGMQGRSVHIDNIATLDPQSNPDAELMMRLQTGIINEYGRYFTDSNGFQLVGRKYRKELPVGANFYPITSMAVLEDRIHRLTLHAAQPHGIGSFSDGHLDVMIERIPMSKGKGLEEPVTDQKPAPSKFLLSLEKLTLKRQPQHVNKDFIEYPSFLSTLLNDHLQSPIQIFAIANVPKAYVPVLNMLRQTIPPDVVFSNIKTLMSDNHLFRGTGITLHKRRMSCVFPGNSEEKHEIDLKSMFNNLVVGQVDKMSLTHVHSSERAVRLGVELEPGEMDSYFIKWNDGKE